MVKISSNNYKIYNIHNEYCKICKIIFDLQNHIQKCHQDDIINIDEMRTLLDKMNEYLEETMECYKNEIKKNNMKIMCEYQDINIYEKFKKTIIEYPVKITNSNKKLLIDITYNPFLKIKKNILKKVCNKIGFKNLNDGMILLISENYKQIYDKNIIRNIDEYNEIFIPINYELKNIEEEQKNIILKNNDDNDMKLTKIISIIIPKVFNASEKISLIFNGYFQNDSLNVLLKTPIFFNQLFNKKKEFEDYISKKELICDINFIKSYILNTSIIDIYTKTKEEYMNDVIVDYKKYTKLSTMKFINLMNEFKKANNDTNKNNIINIKEMYKIIKLLLLGNNQDAKTAELLYKMSNDMKTNLNKNISELIYKNLTYDLQKKLNKINIYIKNEIKTTVSSKKEKEKDYFKEKIIVSKKMPKKIKEIAIKKIEEMDSRNNEYYKQQLYIKTLLDYPWIHETNNDKNFNDFNKNKENKKKYIDSIINKLDNYIYGNNLYKDSIKEQIAKWISNPSSSGAALSLTGPPGVGKTLMAQSIGKALNIPFVQINLGGQNDGDILHGQSYAYIGAQPGMIIKKMCESGESRCVMFFDELDKACNKHDKNEIYNILIHLIDPITNNNFQDRFFQGITFPLNQVLFIFSYNDNTVIDKILLDRITEIQIKPYQVIDKINIASEFLIKEMNEIIGFDNKFININKENLRFIIEEYTNESGVRDLKRKLEKIFLKINLEQIYDKGIFSNLHNYDESIYINKNHIVQYLGQSNNYIEQIHKSDIVGIVNTLYATEDGQGGIIPIQIFINYSDNKKFELKLTGNQGNNTRESVMLAFTTSLNFVNNNVRNKFLQDNPYGLHIHLSGYSISKNGSSAGAAFATAFISRILDKKIKHDVAITGEIDLTGKIKKIGGLEYKLIGAKKAGIKLVIIPNENKDELFLIKKNFSLIDNNFKVIMVDSLSDILDYSIIDFDKSFIN